MPTYLNSEAAKELLEIIKISYFYGLCSWSETASRLIALAVLSGPSQETQIALRTLAMNDLSLDNHWTDETTVEQDMEEATDTDGPQQTEGKHMNSDWMDDDDPLILQLIPASSTRLSGWQFHQADADYFPSIPHGHWQSINLRKLDPYTGWIYLGSQQKSREKRKSIVALWNDQKFRKFARSAIDFYLGAFPSYSGWRVKDPRLLPRRR